jgi:hypothetical protein
MIFLFLVLLDLTFLCYKHIDSFSLKVHNRFTSNYLILRSEKGSEGIEIAINYLNSEAAQPFANKKIEKANFWTGSSFTIDNVKCIGIVEEGIQLKVKCNNRNKIEERTTTAKFPFKVTDEVNLKNALVELAIENNRLKCTADILRLKFGKDFTMPTNFRFNDVPHPTWLRSYIYDAITRAVLQAIADDSIVDKSRLQLRVNYPEVNPAFDTYRIGSILEIVRSITLALAENEGKRVRICVQQSLGEGYFFFIV